MPFLKKVQGIRFKVQGGRIRLKLLVLTLNPEPWTLNRFFIIFPEVRPLHHIPEILRTLNSRTRFYEVTDSYQPP